MTGIEQLLTVARVYADAENIDLGTVSSRACNDGKKLPAIESGADITVGRFEATMQWFSDNWPSNTAWPVKIPRPTANVNV